MTTNTTQSIPTTGPTTGPTTVLPRPRIRTGAVVWGLIVTAVGLGSLALLTSDERRQAVADWVLSLTPFGFFVVGIAALGAFIMVIAIVVLIRGAQRARIERELDAQGASASMEQ
jgi:hypothetical protein